MARRVIKLDQFYTNPEVVDLCLGSIDLDEYDLAIEPSAGSGAFYNKLTIEKIGIDLCPKDIKDVFELDYLKITCDEQELKEKTLVIGNPPFGKSSSLAVKFFNHSARFCATIAFIVPKTFKKPSIQNRLNLNFHLKYELDLPQNSFYLPDGTAYDVPCAWQVWKRGEKKRKKIKMSLTHSDFEFVTRKEDANFLFQRVGAAAGSVHKNFDRANPAHHLIKAPDSVYEVMKHIDWNNSSKYHTAGNPSISKGELVAAYERAKRRTKK